MSLAYEQGPIRPPSEAESLLLRLTRGCPWNKCAFCHTYRDIRFSRRPLAELRQEIANIKELADRLQAAAWRRGQAGRVDRAAVQAVFDQTGVDASQLAVWLAKGAKTAFLQDADCLVLPTDELLAILALLKESFPSLERVTTYGRAKTLLRKSVDELKALKAAGVSRIHTGLESGCDAVLALIDKGATAADYIEAAGRVKAAGIEQCEYVILGLGGKALSRQHALETAAVLNAINPEYIRVHSLAVAPDMPLWAKVQSGEFQSGSEDELVAEQRLLLENLTVEGEFLCLHSLNLLNQVNGRLPADRERLLGMIDAYQSLPEGERLNYQLGRRAFAYQSLADLANAATHRQVENALQRLQAEGRLEEALQELRRRCV